MNDSKRTALETVSVQSTDDSRKVYDKIYRTETPTHLTGAYGSHTNRDGWFTDYATQHIPKGARILDASCGRGHLSRKLISLGYQVEATEISDWLIKNELTDLKVRNIAYDEYDVFPDNHFDAVCSSDVLEHLASEADVLAALGQFKRIASGHLLISIGLHSNKSEYAKAAGLDIDLHAICPGEQWWEREIGRVMTIAAKATEEESAFFAGQVRK